MNRGHEFLRLAPCWLSAVLLSAAMTGCDMESPLDDPGRPIAWVGGEKLTSADLRFQGPADEPDQRRVVIDRGIDDLLVAREARRRGLGYTEQAVRQLVAIRRAARIRERKVLRDVLYEVLSSEVEISEAELQEEFERINAANPRRLVTLRVHAFGSRESAEQADNEFASASEIVGPLLVRELPAALRPAAKRLDAIGERVVVRVEPIWSSVELIAEQIVAPPAIDRARDALMQRLQRRKADKAFERELARLRAATEIRLEPGVLENESLWPTGATSEGPSSVAQPY